MQDSSCIFYIFCHSIPVTIQFQWVSGYWVVDVGVKYKAIEKFGQVSPSHRYILGWFYFAIISAWFENSTWSEKVVKNGSTIHTDL